MNSLIAPLYHGWLNACESRELVIKFMNSLKDGEEEFHIPRRMFSFVAGLPRLDSYDVLLEENTYESIEDCISRAGPFKVKAADDLFKILRRSLEDKLRKELCTDIINITNMCFLRLLDWHFEDLADEFPQLKDEDFIERLDERISLYEVMTVTLGGLKHVIEELTEEEE